MIDGSMSQPSIFSPSFGWATRCGNRRSPNCGELDLEGFVKPEPTSEPTSLAA